MLLTKYSDKYVTFRPKDGNHLQYKQTRTFRSILYDLYRNLDF